MGALPGQLKGGLYGAEVLFMRTWFPPQAQGLLECLSDAQVCSVVARATELSPRNSCFNDPESLRVALIELFAWGSFIERLDYATELVQSRRRELLLSEQERHHDEYRELYDRIYGQPRW